MQHAGVNQLEARLREKTSKIGNVNAGTQANSIESELSGLQSQRGSRLTHLVEPTLVTKFSKKAHELENLI